MSDCSHQALYGDYQQKCQGSIAFLTDAVGHVILCGVITLLFVYLILAESEEVVLVLMSTRCARVVVAVLIRVGMNT